MLLGIWLKQGKEKKTAGKDFKNFRETSVATKFDKKVRKFNKKVRKFAKKVRKFAKKVHKCEENVKKKT